MSQDTSWLPLGLAEPLTELKSWVRWQWLLRGFSRVICLAVLGLSATFVLDYGYDLSPNIRMVALTIVGAIACLSLLTWVVIPLYRRMGWNDLAAMADKAHPEWEGSLTSAVELFDPSEPEGFKGSPVMREMLIAQMQERVDELDLERVVSSRRAWRAVQQALVLCALFALPVFVWPSAYRQLWQRLMMPWGNWGTVGAWVIDVADGDRVVARGTDVTFIATAAKSDQKELPKSLLLEWRDSSGTSDRRAMPFDEARQAFVAIVPHVMKDLDYRVLVEKQKSRDYRVQVVEPPVVTKVRLDIEPPAYSGWPAQSLDGAIGTIRVFEQSRLKFSLEFNKPVETASLAWRHDAEPVTFDVDAVNPTASGELTADQKIAGPFSFAIADIHKLTNSDVVPRELLIVADEPPKLTVKGDHSTEVRPNDVVPIDVTALDDIGVGELELHFQITNGPEQLTAAENVRGQKSVEHRFTLDLSQLKVEHGQWLTYKVRTTDERPQPAPHEVWSEPRVLRINQKAAPPGSNELAKTQEELRQELSALRREVEQQQKQTEQLRKLAEQSDNNKSIQPPAADRFQEVEQRLAELSQRTDKLSEQLTADPIFHELGEQAREVGKEQLPEAAKDIQHAREQESGERVNDLKQAEQKLTDAAKKLQQLEKPFVQLADLQKDLLELNRLARQAEQLANRADELAKSETSTQDLTKKPEASARDEKQKTQASTSDEQNQNPAEAEKQQLVDQQKQLADSLNDLFKRRPELLDAARRDQLEQLSELVKEASQLADQQKELADALRQQQAAGAERNAELAEKQQDLQKRVEVASEKAVTNNEPQSIKPPNSEPLKAAAAALKQGDLAEAQKQQQQAANELDRLATELQKAKTGGVKPDDAAPGESPELSAKPNAAGSDSKPNSKNELAQAARELANDQKQLADKSTEALKSNDTQQLQKAVEQLQRDQATLNDRIENLPANKEAKPSDAEPIDADKPNADKPNADKPNADKPNADKPNADKPNADKPNADKPNADKPNADKPNADKPNADKPNADKPNADKPNADKPNADKPNADKPNAEAKPSAALAARLEAQKRAEQAEQALADGNLEKAVQEQRLAEQALRQLAKQADQPQDRVAQRPQSEDPKDVAQAQEQLSKLAEEQRQLAQEVAQALNEQRGQQPPSNAQTPNADQPKRNSDQNPQAQPSGKPSESQLAQQVREAQQAQQELAQQAQQLQKQVEQELGNNSVEAKQSQQTARQSESSKVQSSSGQFGQASQSGKQAAQAAQQLSESLRDNTRANPNLAQQADELAKQQSQVAQQMEELGENPNATNQAQQQRQQQLNDAAEDLKKQVARSQDQLSQKPLDMPKSADEAKAAGEQTARSQQNMQAAKEASQSGNAGQASLSAEQAAQALQKAAENLQAAAEKQTAPKSPLPRGVGEQAAQAADNLKPQPPKNQPNEQGKGEQGKAEQGKGEQGKGEQGKGEQGKGEQGKGEQGKGEQGKGEQGKGEQGKGEQGKGEQGKGEQGKGEQGKGEQGKGEQGKGEQGKGGSVGDGAGTGKQEAQVSPSRLTQELSQMAQQLRQAARALSQAAQQSIPPKPGPASNGVPGDNPPSEEVLAQQGGGGSGGGGNADSGQGENIGDLQVQVKKMTGRNWGQLSSQLKTELTQAAKHQAHGDYSKLIKLYFQEIAKTQESSR